MLKIRKLIWLFSFLAAFIISSCGVTKKASENTQDGIQTTFFNNKFGDSFFKVKNRMQHKVRDYSDDKNQQKYMDLDFGGYSWHFVTFEFSLDRKFMIIDFSQEFKTKHSGEIRYDNLKEMLDKKYGFGFPITDGVGYKDKYGRAIQLTLKYAESRGKEMFWYCSLMYADVSIVHENQNAAAADL